MQYVHVVREWAKNNTDQNGVISVHDTRQRGLVAALQAVAEYVQYDWSIFDEKRLQDFANLCEIGDESALANALYMWNNALCLEYDDDCPYRVCVSIEMMEIEDRKLDMEFPARE